MVPFRFTRKIDKVTFKLGPEQLGESGRRVFQHAFATAND